MLVPVNLGTVCRGIFFCQKSNSCNNKKYTITLFFSEGRMNSISNYTNIYSPRNWKNNEKYCYFYGCVLHARLTCSVASNSTRNNYEILLRDFAMLS